MVMTVAQVLDKSTVQVADASSPTAVGFASLPPEWEVKQLKQIARSVRGASPRPAGHPRYFNGSHIPWLTVAALTNIPESTIIVSETATCLTEEGSRQSRTLEPGTVIISNSGATLGVAKILAIKCCANDGIAALLDLDENISPPYLVHYINSKTEYLRRVVARGNGQPNLNTTLIGDFAIALPRTKREQEAIAEAFADANSLIDSLQQLIAKKRHIKHGAIQELLSGRRRLPRFSRQWETKKVGDLLSIRHGKSQKPVVDQNGSYPVLATGGEIGRSRVFLYDKPSVLIGRKGTIDRPQYMDRPFWTVDTLFYSSVNEPHSAKFIYYAFLLVDWMRHNEASGVPSLNAKTIEQIELLVPPSDEQEAIAAAITDMDTELDALELRLQKARQIKQGMVQELLTGRVRLV